MFLLIVILVFVLLYYLYIKPLWYWKSRNVPYENPLPIFGNMAKAIFKREHFMSVLNRIYREFPNSPYFGFISFQKNILVITDPELIKKVTIKDFDVFHRHQAIASDDIEPLLSKNLFSIQDIHKWRHLRVTLSPSFTSNKLRMMFDLMQECAENFANYYLKKGDDIVEVDLKDAFRRFATDVIATAAFGITCNSLENQNNEFYVMGRDITNFGGIKALKFFLVTSSPALMKFLRIKLFGDKVTQFFTRIVSDNIRTREEQKIIRPDMIQLLLDARKGKVKREKPESNEQEHDSFAAVDESEIIQNDVSRQKEITDQDITAQALIFFLGGFEMTSTIMSIACAELAVNPDVQKKLNQEINEVFERTGGKFEYDNIQRMKYMDMVTAETLRKWSSVMDREAVKPYTISQDNGKPPLKIEKGDLIWIPVYSIHRDPKYFPDPEKFDPERFSEERKREIQSFTYMPFGMGPRNCIGSRFALLEVKIALFNILRHFEIVPTDKTSLPFKLDASQLGVNLQGGYIFGLKKRNLNIYSN